MPPPPRTDHLLPVPTPVTAVPAPPAVFSAPPDCGTVPRLRKAAPALHSLPPAVLPDFPFLSVCSFSVRLSPPASLCTPGFPFLPLPVLQTPYMLLPQPGIPSLLSELLFYNRPPLPLPAPSPEPPAPPAPAVSHFPVPASPGSWFSGFPLSARSSILFQ